MWKVPPGAFPLGVNGGSFDMAHLEGWGMRPLPELMCEDFRPATGCNQPKHPGTLVEIGTNRGPRYRIVAVHEGEAWLRPLSNGQAGLAPLHQLRVVAEG